ncbi:MAG: tRNA lysidine(34) synthetase TilS [Erysipelotrichaceae bacterium]
MNTVIVGVSGGADSMALLALYKNDYHIIAAHVNYGVREEANLDQELVREYCIQNNIIFECTQAGKLTGNFQAAAREYRYNYFAKLAEKYQASYVLIAHHLNDHLETYLLQKQRQAIVSYFGLAEKQKIKGVDIIRPLLLYTKKQLIEYCQKQNIKYAIDSSNLSTKYSRNKIRIEVVEKMSPAELRALEKEITNKNKALLIENKQIELLESLDYLLYQNLDLNIKVKLLYRFLKKNGYYHLSNDHVKELLRVLELQRIVEFKDKYLLLTKANRFAIKEKTHIKLESLEYGIYQDFKLLNKGKTIESVNIKNEDFPITIRAWQASDKIKMKFGSKKVSRFLIDRKIALVDRFNWLVIENQKGEVIFVSGLGCDLQHYSLKPNLYLWQKYSG